MQKDWIFTVENSICDLRTVGVLIRDRKILVQRDRGGNEYALPGGHVKIGETLEDGLIREFKEETDADIKCIRLLWIEECFWEWNGKTAHSFTFYYQVALCDTDAIPDASEFVPHHDNDRVVLGWIPMDTLQDVTVYPEFLAREILCLDGVRKHFVSGV